VAKTEIVLFDLGGFCCRSTVSDGSRHGASAGHHARDSAGLHGSDIHARLDIGQASEAEVAAALSEVAGRTVTAAETRALLLSVFEPPNMPLWDLVWC